MERKLRERYALYRMLNDILLDRSLKAVADLSFEYGVSTFIFSSVERGGERDDDKAILDRLAKVKIERHIRNLGANGLSWTCVVL